MKYTESLLKLMTVEELDFTQLLVSSYAMKMELKGKEAAKEFNEIMDTSKAIAEERLRRDNGRNS